MARSTHVRVNKDVYRTQKQMFPEYSAGDVYKLGFNTLKGISKMNDFLYGKKKNVKKK